MMTPDAAERYIFDTIRRHQKYGRILSKICIHPDYHHIVDPIAPKYGLEVVVDSNMPLSHFSFQ